MTQLLIVYHSLTGGTAQMVQAAATGVRSEATVGLRVLRAAEATVEDVLAAEGYIFATPENLAGMSGQLKDFFDRTYYAALDRVAGRPYALLVCAGSDGTNAVRQIERILTGWRLRAISDALIVCTHAQTPESILQAKTIPADSLERCRELGATLAAGLALGIY